MSQADIPEETFTNPFGENTFLHKLYGKVYRANRDLVIIVSDKQGRRGTGKTVMSLQLADKMDQTDEGLTYEKCTLSAEELRNQYATQPPKSGLVLDEGEVGAGNRDAMTVTNKALREVMSMGRVEQKYLVVNAPLKGFIDKDILKLADVWIAMEKRGTGLVHHLDYQEYSETLLTRKKQRLTVDDIDTGTDLRSIYNKLTRDKRKRISGDEGGGNFIRESKAKEREQQAKAQARKQTRDELVQELWQSLGDMNEQQIEKVNRYDGLTQSMFASALGVTQQQISNIVTD